MTARPRSRLIGLAAVTVLVALASHRAISQPSRNPQTIQPVAVAVVGVEYAFLELPPTLSPGPTLFSFENHGTKRHEMSLVLLKMGVTLDQLIRAGEAVAIGGRAVADSLVGLLIARPGERSGGQLYVNLLAGRSYLVICTLKDTPDASRHAVLGMIGEIRVR